MGYYFTYLSKGEQLRTSAETASAAVLPNAVAACAILILTLKLGYFFSEEYGDRSYIITIIGAVISAVLTIPRIMSVSGTELALTSRKVFGSAGFWGTDETEFPISSIKSVSVRHGIFGRLFHYGDIVISTESGRYIFRFIRYPDAFSDKLTELPGSPDGAQQ